jgi:hypothetical protein
MPGWTTPSDQVSEYGGVPVRATWIVPSRPEQIVPPPETTADGGGVSETTWVELAVQVVGSVTVTPSVTVEPVGVNETDALVELPPNVPPAIVQAYVAPGPELGTEAMSPVAPLQKPAGAAMATEGSGLTVTVALPVPDPAGQPEPSPRAVMV